jgi:gluconolactonase
LDTLAFGYGLAEAPRADASGGVYFSDVLGGGVFHRSPGGDVTEVLAKRRGIGGLLIHRDGGLVVSGRDLCHVRDGATRTLLAPDGVRGFNDIVTDHRGRVFAGALRYHPLAGEDPVPGEVWRIDGRGTAEVVVEGITWPNGIGVSPDGATLYVCDYASGTVMAHPLGGAGATEVFARSPDGSADGLAVDEEGGVWVALGAGGAVARFSPDGTLDRTLDVPATFVTSVSFGGEDMRDLYVTTADNTEDPARSGTLFRARADVAGLPVAPAVV